MPRSTRIPIGVPAGYPELFTELKTRIRSAQVRAAFAVNRELILLYWSVGRDILARQADQGWGAKVIDRLAGDLQTEFPGIQGFSPRSLKYMRSFAAAWPDESVVRQVAAQLPWGHHMVLLDRAKNAPTRLWYLHAAVKHGWSRNILVHMIVAWIVKWRKFLGAIWRRWFDCTAKAAAAMGGIFVKIPQVTHYSSHTESMFLCGPVLAVCQRVSYATYRSNLYAR